MDRGLRPWEALVVAQEVDSHDGRNTCPEERIARCFPNAHPSLKTINL